jgi:hypothetical protein
MDFIPEKPVLEVDEIRIDKKTMETLAFMSRRRRSGRRGCLR